MSSPSHKKADAVANILRLCIQAFATFGAVVFVMFSRGTSFEVRKALAWSGCTKLTKIWQSNLNRKIKIIATVETILLYRCESWAIDKTFEKQLNGCYTGMLRTAFNV